MKDSISLDNLKSIYDIVATNHKVSSYDITDQVITYIKNLNQLVDEPNLIYLRDGKFILSSKAALLTVSTLNFINEGQRYKFVSTLLNYLNSKEDLENDVIG